MNYSTTQATNITTLVSVLVLILGHFNIGIAQEEVSELVAGSIAVISIVHSWVNRYKKGDITLGGFKK